MKALSFFRSRDVTLESVHTGRDFRTVVLEWEGRRVELCTFVNLGPPILHRRLRRALITAAQELERGALHAVLYELPFRLSGWTLDEWRYWLRIYWFQRAVNKVDIIRRIQKVSSRHVPKSVTCMDGVGYLRKHYPALFRLQARIAVLELAPFMARPKKALETEWKYFIRTSGVCGPHMEPLMDAYMEGNAVALMKALHARDDARVRMFVPLGVAMRLRDHLLFERGFTVCTDWHED
jgi:hypothetical protein